MFTDESRLGRRLLKINTQYSSFRRGSVKVVYAPNSVWALLQTPEAEPQDNTVSGITYNNASLNRLTKTQTEKEAPALNWNFFLFFSQSLLVHWNHNNVASAQIPKYVYREEPKRDLFPEPFRLKATVMMGDGLSLSGCFSTTLYSFVQHW